ncbi:hypothetical protein HY993_04855 [Candidatus Micrarchaeota archaeon]|nr:hypothetical protein [Candidatus Micrarchaeota archaeon]
MDGDSAKVFSAKDNMLQMLSWADNPFIKDLRVSDKENFLKYYSPFEANAILEKLAFDSKACLFLGPKGVGKTSALYFVDYSLPQKDFIPVMFKQLPESIEQLALESGLFEREKSLLSKIFGAFSKKREFTRAELIDGLKSFDKKIVFFFDEAHLVKNRGMYMELKYLLDEVPNLRMVFSALGADEFPDSLMHLIGEKNVFVRKGFSRDEMLDIISHRIKAVGGSGLKPFNSEIIDRVLTEQNLLTPRYVFDELNSYLAKLALDGKLPDAEDGALLGSSDPIVQAVKSRGAAEDVLNTSNADWWVSLSPSQQVILELLLSSGDGLTLNSIMGKTRLSQNTAFNALYQLRGADEAEIKRKPAVPFPLISVDAKLVGGRKKNVYFASEKIRNLFTMH